MNRQGGGGRGGSHFFNVQVSGDIILTRFLISLKLKTEFEIEEYIEIEIFNICDHLPRWEHPTFIDITFDHYPQIDFQINIKYNNHLWEILELPEPIYYTDSDL